jgi:tRNA (guanine-N7-)-methyltransferase
MIRAVQKLEELELNNLKLIRLDAKEIENIFDKEISRIYLNFSDPWPKDRHAKRRLTSPEFLKRYENIFKNNEEIIMKTDNRKLFEYSIMMFNENNFKIENISLNLYEDNYLDNIPTEYEIKFHEKGFPIYRVHVTKK